MTTTITDSDLSHVTGGGAVAPGADALSSDGIVDALTSPSAKMGGLINPGGQVFENSHAGPSAYERVNSAFDNSTRAMRTFNELGGVLTQAPGFGRGDVLKP